MQWGVELMSRMQSPPTTRASFSIDEDTLNRLDDLADVEGYDSRSEKLRELVEEEVGAGDDGRDEYVPDVEVHAAVYRAALGHAKKPEHVVRIDVFGSQIAQEAGVSTSTVENILYVLQGAGYARRQSGHPGDTLTMESWKIKPLCADPGQWKHRKKT